MVLLRETLPDRGIAVRNVVDDAADSYCVESTPLSGGVVTDEWTVFGGSVGYDASVFAADAAARAFVERVRTTSHDDVLAELAVDTDGATK
ncbi:hypothetical protein [Haloferax volcanii]|uniref:Uncharacterized protein n=1 Tax=Haloferax volcanii JCM 10717 TaxID=1227458 RepID=M0ICC2_HALVO|nr:hypothetical protein [Haloferax alexandrinus]ELZ94440.1 hypothetical protein C452_02040 [Haloferax alexandrinus JCM 10717]